MDGGRATDDRFAFVRRATGRVSNSQNEIFDVDSIIDPVPETDPVVVPNAAPVAAEPILMCTLPNTPMPSAAETLGLGSAKGKSPAKSSRKLPASILYRGPEHFVPDGWLPHSSDKGKAKAGPPARRASSRKRRGAKINQDAAVEVTGKAAAAAAASSQIPPVEDDLQAVGNVPVTAARQPSQKPSPKISLADAMEDLRASSTAFDNMDILDILAMKGNPFPNDFKARESSSSQNQPLKLSLAEAMRDFMSPSTVLDHMDILEVLAMKGTHLANPSWWRKGGYDAKPKNAK